MANRQQRRAQPGHSLSELDRMLAAAEKERAVSPSVGQAPLRRLRELEEQVATLERNSFVAAEVAADQVSSLRKQLKAANVTISTLRLDRDRAKQKLKDVGKPIWCVMGSTCPCVS